MMPPLLTIVSKDRNVLAISVGPEGNIRYPRSESGQTHFRAMLESTSTRLSPDEIETLLKAIDED